MGTCGSLRNLGGWKASRLAEAQSTGRATSRCYAIFGRARLEAGLTQEEAGRALGKPKSFVSKCELGERRIDPIDLQDFAALYGKPLTFFVRSSDSPVRSSSRSR
jgi:transcriptional regulator with XRE-family HTH domain